MPPTRPQTIPVFLLVRTAYQLLWQQKDDALRLGLIPTLICFGALLYGGDAFEFATAQFHSSAPAQPTAGVLVSLMVMVLIILVAAGLATANWLRFMLLGPMAAVGIGLNIGRAHVGFIVSCVVLAFAGLIAVSVLSMPIGLLPASLLQEIGLVVVSLVVLVVVARLLPFAVAQAIAQPLSLQQAWNASRGNGLALAMAIILVFLPIWVGSIVLALILYVVGFAAAAPLAMHFLNAVLDIILAILVAIVLATAFRQMVGIRV